MSRSSCDPSVNSSSTTRLIRLLQVKLRRKFEVAINPGNEQNAPVGTGQRRVSGSGVAVARARPPAARVIGSRDGRVGQSPRSSGAMDAPGKAARRISPPLCACGHGGSRAASVPGQSDRGGRIWSYQSIGDQVRFALVHRVARRRQAIQSWLWLQPAPVRREKPARPAPPARKHRSRRRRPRSPRARKKKVE